MIRAHIAVGIALILFAIYIFYGDAIVYSLNDINDCGPLLPRTWSCHD